MTAVYPLLCNLCNHSGCCCVIQNSCWVLTEELIEVRREAHILTQILKVSSSWGWNKWCYQSSNVKVHTYQKNTWNQCQLDSSRTEQYIEGKDTYDVAIEWSNHWGWVGCCVVGWRSKRLSRDGSPPKITYLAALRHSVHKVWKSIPSASSNSWEKLSLAKKYYYIHSKVIVSCCCRAVYSSHVTVS